jgi:hypothetical protein
MPKAFFDIESRDGKGHSFEKIAGNDIVAAYRATYFPPPVVSAYNPPPMKIAMMLHFAITIGPYEPETQRTSHAYTKFIIQLLREGMVERPTKQERLQYPGWAYRATAKGRAYVEGLRRVQLPVLEQKYVVGTR